MHRSRRSTSAQLFTGLCLFVATTVFAQPVVLTPLKPSGIYARGEQAGWRVEFPTPSSGSPQTISYTLKKNGAEVIKSGTLESSKTSTLLTAALAEPAMLYLEVNAATADQKPIVAGAAIAPTELKPVAPCPADFDQFWKSKIELLHSIAPNPVVTAGESGRADVEYSTLKLNNVHGSHVYGQIAKPAHQGKRPAMLILQWAGGPYPLQKSWVVDRAAEGWLALNIEPHDVPGDLPAQFYDALPAMIKSYNTIYDDDRERNYFLRMYLGAYRAVDYLAGLPEWDGKTLLVMGTSMGGQQSLAVAGLHPKITHVIVHVPAGADSNATLHGRATGYPNWNASNPKVMETALYFDTVNFAGRIKATCLISMGFLDMVCPPAGIWTAFNQIPAPKEVVPLVNAAHNHQSTPEQQQAYTDRANAWLTALVKGEAPEIRAMMAPVGN